MCNLTDTLDYKLKIGGHLHKAHSYPEPLELAPVGNKGRVIGRGTLEWGVVEASLQVQYADPLSLPKLCLILPHAIELALVLGHPFIDQNNVLAHLVGLPGLNDWY